MKNDDIETLRILFGATIGELCNQERWNDAKEMEGIKDRLIQALENQDSDCKIHFEVKDDVVMKYTPMPEIGENTYKTEVVMTKEIFQECYKRWARVL